MESHLSASGTLGKYTSPVKFLGHKRELKPSLKDNYLFRRIINGKIEGNYEAMANIYYNLMSFDWDEEKLNKIRTSIRKIKQHLYF